MPESQKFLARYFKKLRKYSELSKESELAFIGLAGVREEYRKSQTIVREGEPSARLHLITKGSAYRYKTLRNGERQILSFHMANEIVDFQPRAPALADFGVRACDHVESVTISATALMELAGRFADLAQALWLSCLAEAAMSREWLANCGRRSTRGSIIHLLLEFATRFKYLSLSDGWKFQVPFTQMEIADAVGSSPVQVNRIMQALRGEHLIRSYGSTLVIEEYDKLAHEADFTPFYLGLH